MRRFRRRGEAVVLTDNLLGGFHGELDLVRHGSAIQSLLQGVEVDGLAPADFATNEPHQDALRLIDAGGPRSHLPQMRTIPSG